MVSGAWQNYELTRSIDFLGRRASSDYDGWAIGASAQVGYDIALGSAAVIEPMPIAVPAFIDEGGAGDYAKAISDVVTSDLEGTGFFRTIGEDAYISRITSFDGGIAFMRLVPTRMTFCIFSTERFLLRMAGPVSSSPWG